MNGVKKNLLIPYIKREYFDVGYVFLFSVQFMFGIVLFRYNETSNIMFYLFP